MNDVLPLAETPEEKTAVFFFDDFDDGLQGLQHQESFMVSQTTNDNPRALIGHGDRQSGSSPQYCSFFFRGRLLLTKL